jgi:hypothetical protein
MTYLEGLPEPPAARATPSPSWGRRVGLAVASVAVVAGAAFAAVNIASGDENEPIDPVREIIEAAERGDVIGILEQLEPGERDALRDPLVDLTEELNRLGVLKDASLSKLTGYELDVNELELQATEVHDGVQRVRVTRGSSTYSFDPSKLPFGPFVRERAGDALASGAISGSSEQLQGDDEDDVVVVKRGGRWYVSIGYSIAEGARQDADVSWEDMGPGVAPEGADSPQEAVRAILTAASELDPRKVIALLPPGEMGALQTYAGLFIEEAEGAGHFAKRSFSISIPKLELDADTDGNHSIVTIREIEVEADGEGTVFSYKDGCVEFSGPGAEPVRVCRGDDPSTLFRDLYGITGGFPMPELPTAPSFSFSNKEIQSGITATRVDGRWYVSPTRTLLDNVVSFLKVVQPSDLDKGADWIEELQAAFERAMVESFTGDFESFDDDGFEIDEFDEQTTETTVVYQGESQVSAPPRM